MRFGSLRKKEQKPKVSFDSENANNDDEDTSATNNNPDHTSVEMNNNKPDTNLPKPTTKDVLSNVIEVRGDGISALKRTEATMKLAEESGQESMKTLAKNDEVLKRAEKIADEMEMRTMDKEIRTMGRRLGRDKCFLCLTVCVVAAVVIGIILPLVKPFDLFNNDAGPLNYTTSSSTSNDGSTYSPGESESYDKYFNK